MSKNLALVAAVSLFLCLAFLDAARWIGGDAIFHDPHSLEGLRPLIDLATRKEWRWAGGDTLAMDAPMALRYQPAGAPGVAVTGPTEALKHVHFREGRIGSDTAMPKGLKAVVSGVTIRKFVVNSGETLELGHVVQPVLEIHINGSGAVHGDGKVDRLNLTINGSGDAELGGLSVGDARVALMGSGSATLSPHGAVTLMAAGSGRLSLLTKPSSIQRTILGSTEIVEGSRTAPPSAPAPPVPPVSNAGDAVMVTGGNDVDLGQVDREKLTVSILGSGNVRGEGKVGLLIVNATGSGRADLGKIIARRAEVTLAGSADVTVAPLEYLHVAILGSGNVRLVSRPGRIERTLAGPGHLIELH
jgi:hypothetical protein